MMLKLVPMSLFGKALDILSTATASPVRVVTGLYVFVLAVCLYSLVVFIVGFGGRSMERAQRWLFFARVDLLLVLD